MMKKEDEKRGHLVLEVKEGTVIKIGDVEIKLWDIGNYKAKVGILAPRDLRIGRVNANNLA